MIDPAWLAGPVVRRVSRTEVHVWIAARRPVRARLDLFQVIGTLRTKLVSLPSDSTSESVPIGRNLHVCLITARPQDGRFPVGIIAYDLLAFVETDQEGGLRRLGRLKDIGLLGANGIAYGSQRVGLPTFKIEERQWPAILHGSCRKLHGYGSDRFVEADLLVANSLATDERPAALFLTGDQIYADDVSGELLPHLTRIGRDLIGDEMLSKAVKGSRSNFVRKMGLTTSAGSSHVLALGEFVALYLLAMGPELWPKWLKTKELKGGTKAAASARRVLANTPTYMIFDDHEITDDWNITTRVIDAIDKNRTTRTVVGNGLCACWAFQDWGNDPAASRHAPIKRALVSANGDHRRLDGVRDVLLGLDASLGWTFVAPTSPPAVFIDTRTHRNASAGSGPDSPLELMNDAALVRAAELLRGSGWRSGEPLILVSPTPIIGLSTVEFHQEQMIASSKKNVYKWDGEYWKANLLGWGRLISWLLTLAPSYVVTLSGDVHYGFQARATVKGYGPFSGKILRMFQLTSSPIKNALDEKQRLVIGFLGGLGGLPGKDVYAYQVTPYSSIRSRPQDDLELITWEAARDLLGKSPTDAPQGWVLGEKLRPVDPLWLEERELEGSMVRVNNVGLVRLGKGDKLFHSLVVGQRQGRPLFKHASFRLPGVAPVRVDRRRVSAR